MTKALQIKKGTEQGVLDFLKQLLEHKRVTGVFTLKKISNDGAVAYCLIADPHDLKDAVPLYPLMPVNAGKLLSRFTLLGGSKKPVVAVVKPCELRGLVELIKREQGSLENLFIISSTCGGVYPTKMSVDGTIEKKLTNYHDVVKRGETSDDVRPTCRSCEEFVPYTADITVDVLGNNDSDTQCVLLLNTSRGEQLSTDIPGELVEKELDTKKLDTIRKKRAHVSKQLSEELKGKLNSIDGLIDIFGKCISCHGCMRVCPICYCTLCEFESHDVEYKPSLYESELRKKQALRVPPGTVNFHLGRMTHMSISCVACGSCDDVCPVDIPVARIFKKVGESVQKLFNYIPGKDVKEPIPLLTFQEKEFAEVEE